MTLHIKDIKKDQVFFERFSDGTMHEFKATAAPIHEVKSVGEQWSITGTNTEGNEIRFLVTQGMEHYGPRLYNTAKG